MIRNFFKPHGLPIPEAQSFDAPLVSLRFNDSWAEFLIGLLDKALSPGFWDESTGDIDECWDSVIWLIMELGMATHMKYAVLQEEQPSGTQGGASLAAQRQTRTLNTVHFDTDIVSLSNNLFTPVSGAYVFSAFAPAQAVGTHRLYLRNVTDGVDVVDGQNANTIFNPGLGVSNASMTVGHFQTDGTKSYSLEHYTSQAKATAGLGVAVNDGNAEVYSIISLMQIG